MVRSRFSSLFFWRFWSNFGRRTWNSNKNDMSFESPNIWLLGAKKAKGLAAKQGRHALLSEKSSSFIQEGVAAMFCSQTLSFFGSKEPHIRAFKWHIIFVWFPTASTETWSKSSKKQAWKPACTRTFVYKCTMYQQPLSKIGVRFS